MDVAGKVVVERRPAKSVREVISDGVKVSNFLEASFVSHLPHQDQRASHYTTAQTQREQQSKTDGQISASGAWM